MENENDLKELVKQKYSEIALQDKDINHHVVARVAVARKFTILCRKIITNWKAITQMLIWD
jgi:O-phosphoseryl-tRNA(Cys) synthetase